MLYWFCRIPPAFAGFFCLIKIVPQIPGRAEYGPFETAEDLKRVSGIGEAKLAELEGRITVGG